MPRSKPQSSASSGDFEKWRARNDFYWRQFGEPSAVVREFLTLVPADTFRFRVMVPMMDDPIVWSGDWPALKEFWERFNFRQHYGFGKKAMERAHAAIREMKIQRGEPKPFDYVNWHGWPPQILDGIRWRTIPQAEILMALTREVEELREKVKQYESGQGIEAGSAAPNARTEVSERQHERTKPRARDDAAAQKDRQT